jgi:hypothetical protein
MSSHKPAAIAAREAASSILRNGPAMPQAQLEAEAVFGSLARFPKKKEKVATRGRWQP